MFNCLVMFGSGMGICCCKSLWNRRADAEIGRENVDGLRYDLLPFPIQCTDDDDDGGGGGGGDYGGEIEGTFVDLHGDVFPVQCTEQSQPTLQ